MQVREGHRREDRRLHHDQDHHAPERRCLPARCAQRQQHAVRRLRVLGGRRPVRLPQPGPDRHQREHAARHRAAHLLDGHQQEEGRRADRGQQGPQAVARQHDHAQRVGTGRAGDQGLPATGHRAGQPVRAGLDLLMQLGPVPQRLVMLDMRNAAGAVGLARQPLQRRRAPGVVVRLLRAALAADQVDDEQQHPRRDDDRADRRQQVGHFQPQTRRIGVDAARHAQHARQVHREEGQVEAAEDEPEDPAAGTLRQRAPLPQRHPVVEGREHRQHHAADQHVMEMRDHEVGVMDLPVDRQQRQHHAGEPAQNEGHQETDQEPGRRRPPQAAAPQRPDPREDLQRPGDRDRDAEDRHQAQPQPAQPRGEHVVQPEQEADRADGDQRRGDRMPADQRGPRQRRHHGRHQARRRQEDDVDFRVAEEPEQVLPQQRIAAPRGVEDRPVEGPLELQQRRAGDHRREGQHDHQAHHQHRPGIDRHAGQAHAGRPRHQDAGDQLDGAGDR